MAEFHLTDDQFFAVLRENGGLYAVTAKAISETYDINFSRQAVRERALKRPDILTDIEDETLDTAEEGLLSLMSDLDKKIKIDAIKYYLSRRGKKRGYTERVENAVTDSDGNNIQPIININVIRTKKEIDDSL